MHFNRPSIIKVTTSTYQPWQHQHLKWTNNLTNSARKAHPSFIRHLANGRLKLVLVYYTLIVIILSTINCSFEKLERERAWSTVYLNEMCNGWNLLFKECLMCICQKSKTMLQCRKQFSIRLSFQIFDKCTLNISKMKSLIYWDWFSICSSLMSINSHSCMRFEKSRAKVKHKANSS